MRKLHLINYSEDVTVLHGKPRQYRVNIMTFLHLKTFYIYSRRLSARCSNLVMFKFERNEI